MTEENDDSLKKEILTSLQCAQFQQLCKNYFVFFCSINFFKFKLLNVYIQHEYTPGDLTDPYQQHSSRELLISQKRGKSGKIEPQYELNDLYLEKSNSPTHHHHQQHYHHNASKDCAVDVEPINVEDEMTREVTEKPGERNTTPIIPAYCNFQVAKKMHAENLEHQPLPDSIMDRAYRKLQAQGFANPELALDVFPLATGNIIFIRFPIISKLHSIVL